MVFLGPLFKKEEEDLLISKSKSNTVQNQVNSFQWNMIDGLYGNLSKGIRILNVLPVGTWPHYVDIVLKDREWSYNGETHKELGCLNLPFIKQLVRALKTRKELLKSTDKNILIYSAYLPFLCAVAGLNKDYHITLIVTDLPEYYDLGRISVVRRAFRRINAKLCYLFMKRIDAFVLLTEAMKEPLHVGNRTYTIVEGICNENSIIEPHPFEDGHKIIFYSGTLHYQYGIKTLLDAFQLIESPNYELWICGSGEAAEEIEELAKLDHRIRFFGFCSKERVSELRSHATVLVNPRTSEGEYTKYSFPSKTMEYLASGIPLAMFKLEGLPLEYHQYISFFKGAKPIQIASLIRELIENDYNESLIKARKARDFVRLEKNAATQANKVLDLIEKDSMSQ